MVAPFPWLEGPYLGTTPWRMPRCTPRREDATFVGTAVGIMKATDAWEVGNGMIPQVFMNSCPEGSLFPLPGKKAHCASQKSHWPLRHIQPWQNQSEGIPDSTWACVSWGITEKVSSQNGLEAQGHLGSNPSTTAHKS